MYTLRIFGRYEIGLEWWPEYCLGVETTKRGDVLAWIGKLHLAVCPLR